MFFVKAFLIVILLSVTNFACDEKNQIHTSSVVEPRNTNSSIKNLSLSNELESGETKSKTENEPLQKATDWREFNDAKLGISFQYPAKLSVKKLQNGVRIFRQLKLEHSDPCDNSDNIKTLEKFADFDVTILIENQVLPISEECKVNKVISADADFSTNPVCFATENLKGEISYKIYQGCGNLTYNFPLSNKKTLVIKRNLVALLGVGAIPEDKKKAESLSGIILADENNKIFFKIISTLKTKAGA